MLSTANADGIAARPSGVPGQHRPVPSLPGMAGVVGACFDLVPFALCVLDRTQRIVLANAQMAAIVGVQASRLDGRCVTGLFPEFGRVLARSYALAESGEDISSQRVTWRGRTYALTFSATYEADGMLAEMLVGAADITREIRLETRLRRSRRQLLASLRVDHLTGLLNRRGLESAAVRGLRRSCRQQRPIALLIIDIDCFKAYNDRFGHVDGDRCLARIAGTIAAHGRRVGDAVGRYGGEEFVVVLPDTDADAAMRIAESCRSAVEALAIGHPDSPSGKVTVSIGVTAVTGASDLRIDPLQVASCIRAADGALYEAKASGRNAIRFHAP